MRTTHVSALAALCLGVLSFAPGAPAQTCPAADAPPRNLLAGNLMDTFLNPPTGEDSEFYTTSGGIPNIMFLLDTSGSMERLPPNGAAFLSTQDHLPGGHPLTDRSHNAGVGGQNNAKNDHSRVLGCGLDPVFVSTHGSNQMFQAVMQRRFYPACGRSKSDLTKAATAPSSVGDLYRGHYTLVTGGLDYADESSVCPYWTPSDSQKTGDAGYDPDFYKGNSATALTGNGLPHFFGRDLVFHDDMYVEGDYASDTNLAFGHNFAGGWNDNQVFPAKIGNTIATIDTFCNSIDSANTWTQGTQKVTDICKTCLKQAGWFYDGIILNAVDNEVAVQYPSLWYTGNYLNFYPPKFLIARKIIKDVIATQSKVRMGLAKFDDPKTNSRAAEIVQTFNPTCDHPDSNFDSNRGTYVNSVNTINFTGGTPLSRALLDMGRYYRSPGLPWFPNYDGANHAYPLGINSPANQNQYAICYSCQTSNVILMTDGAPGPGKEGSDPTTGTYGAMLPAGGVTTAQLASPTLYAGNTSTGIRGVDTPMCPSCNGFSGADEYKDNTARVAWYLHNLDLRDNNEQTRDCARNGGKQVINTYTVGFATAQLPDANLILANTAEAGGGLFYNADNAQDLARGLSSIIEYINTRDTSFSVATVSTLQTTAGRTVIVPRFEPSRTAHYRGHLLRFDLYSEFVNRCTALPDGSGTGDLDCDGHCSSVFLTDQGTEADRDDFDFVVEDGSGTFVKTESSSAPACSQAPLCDRDPPPAGKSCSAASSAEAKPWWDAGELLKGEPVDSPTSQKWKTRRIFTVVDSDGDGAITGADGVVRLDPENATIVNSIVPYLGLGNESVCNQVAALLSTAGNAPRAAAIAPPTPTAASVRECAKTIIRYVLGADVLNEVGKPTATYLATTESNLWDRAWHLGDNFHSSPVVVDPPLPRTGVLCKNGLSNQCLESLWGTPTSGGEAAYDGYSLSGTYENRNKVGLVGANDGLLHAFHVGTWHGNATPGEHNDAADDDSTSALDESLPPFNGYYDKGTGEEIWAFLPPDMLSKIYLYVTASRHHFFVDGNPWVRDVWVDGTSNGLATARGADNVKQAQEFHTVAVIGERRGGTHFFALDVTNATSSAGTPGFLWVYPQPDSKETLEYGETYNDTLPRPPPIGPVRMAATTGNTMSIDGSDVSYREQWVAFLNGGYDPQYVRGRGVHMVDVWTGEELFDFSYSSVATDVRNNLRFPVPAAVGMVPWGANAVRDPLETNEFFFDTATFGDAGGQLWVLRFHRPGTRGIGLDKRVTNWSGARMFQMGTSSACKLCGGQPFFYMTVNVPISNGKYRLLAGTGDRFNLLDKKGGTCGPDNIRACVLRGCTVTIDQASNLFQSAGLGSEQRGLSQAACGAMTSTQTDGTFTACAANGKAKIVISACPSPDPNNGPTGTTKDVQVGCGPDALGLYSCGKSLEVPGTPLVLSNTSNAINLGNWFYSLLVFEETGNRAIFDDQTAANTYDGARLWLNQTALGTSTQTAGIVTIAATAVNPTPVANADSKGWAMYYSRGTQVTADSHVYNVNWQDERTSSGSAVLGADVYWNTNLTADEIVGTTGSCDVRKCASIQARRISTKYGADVESGGFPARMTDPLTGASVRAIVAALLVPTQSDQPTVFVNQKGQIAVGLTAVNPERGATNVGQTEASDPVQDFGILEVNRKLHACRHDQSCE